MIGKKIRLLREQKNMTQEQLANLVNLSQQTIDHYEKGRAKPSIDTVSLFANIFSVSADYLLGRTGSSESANENNFKFIKMGKIPVYSLNFNGENICSDSNIIGYYEVPAKYMNLISFQVSDDTMIGSRLLPDDIVLVKKQSTAQDNQTVIVQIRGKSAMIRQVTFTEDDGVILSPTNPKYQPQFFKSKDVKIIGVIVKVIFDFK